MKRRNAFFTVEAALVLPMVMSAMLVGIYLFCYQYDRCLLEQDMGRLLICGNAIAAENEGKTEKLADSIKQSAAQMSTEKYAAWKVKKVDIRLEHNILSVSGEGELVFPIPEWNMWNKNNVWEAQVNYKSSRLSPVFFIRQYRKLHGMLHKAL